MGGGHAEKCALLRKFSIVRFFCGGRGLDIKKTGTHCRVDPSGKQTVSAVKDSVSYEGSYRAARVLFTITMTAVIQMKVMIVLRQPNAIYRQKRLDRVTI